MWRDWEQAWERALYAPGGFVHAAGAPATHFRTSVQVGTVVAEAVVELLERVDAALGRPATLGMVDLGAGGGELLAGVLQVCPPGMRARLRPLAVDVRSAPDGWALPWAATLPARVHGLVVAHEWLDALACPVVVDDGTVLRRVQVDDRGVERLGPAAAGPERAWARRWGATGRFEVGLPRDRAWAEVVRRTHGAVLAVDYGTLAPAATLTGYRAGRQVAPAPDGTCDLTAHVHWPSLRAVAPSRLRTQAEALATVRVDGANPLGTLERAGQLAELRAPDGLGGFGWLLATPGLDGAVLDPGLAPSGRWIAP